RYKYYCIIDIKNSIKAVNDFALPFIEHPVTNTSGMCSHGNATTTHNRETTIILTYMSHELTRFLSYLLLNEDIPLLSVTWQEMYPSILVEKPTNIFSFECSYSKGKSTETFLSSLGVTYSAVFYIKEFKEDDSVIRKNCTERKDSAFCHLSHMEYADKYQCIKEIYIDRNNETQVNNSIAFVKAHENLRAIYIYGLYTTYKSFGYQDAFHYFWHPDAKNDFFLAPYVRPYNNETATYQSQESDLKRRKHYRQFQNVPGGTQLEEIMWLITEFKYLLVEGYPQILDGLKYAYPQFSGMTTEQWLSIDVNIRQHFANQIASNSEELKKLLYMWRGITYQKEREENRRDPYLYNAQRQLNKSEPFCNLTKPQCGKGEELIHGFYKEPKWVNSFGWFCQKCQH
uniref:Uncharacterized protein n=1 Tax=Clytia hemisphaerica TaxID=252671 RepID=A0A7M5VEU9_9CNID